MATRISSTHHTFRTALATALSLAAFASVAHAQTQPQAVPVPITLAAAGTGGSAVVSTSCTTGIPATSGVNYGDGCTGPQAGLSSPQGAAVDKYGNVYIGDYSDKLVRVIYRGGANLAAAITAANSGYTIPGTTPRAAPAPVPVVGNIYTIAGTGTTPTASVTVNPYTATNADGNVACTGASGSGADAIDGYGDGCPAASAPIAARDVSVDNDGNLFLTDYTYSRIRVVCVNCASTTLAAQLIVLENPGVTPVNGAIYTIAGFTAGYRDQAPGYGYASNSAVSTQLPTNNVALFRSPTGAVVSASDDVFIADNLNNAVRVLYNGGTAAKNILTAEGYAPVVGSVYTIAGANCVSALGNGTKNGSTTSANSCMTTVGSDTPGLGTVPSTVSVQTATTGVGLGVAWSVYLDPNGNVFYSDSVNARVKVLYGGISAPLSIANPQVGFTYSFAGQGGGTPGAANGVVPSGITLSPAPTAATGGAQGVGGDAAGNIFFTDYTLGYFYQVFAQTGITAIIGGNNAQATIAAGAFCNGGTTGPTAFDASYNGCPLTQTKITSPRGPVVSDNNGNLYFGDSPGYFIRRFNYNSSFAATTVATTGPIQPYAFTFLSAQTLAANTVTVRGATASGFVDTQTADTCTTGLAATASSTCVLYVGFNPTKPGLLRGAVQIRSAAGILGDSLFSGIGNGPGLNVDPAAVTTTGVGLTPNGITVDGAGNVYVSDLGSKSVIEFTNGVAVATPASLRGFTAPAGITIDGTGNIFVADTGANTISEIPVTTGTKFTFAIGLNAPHNLAVDGFGTLYVADTGNNRILRYSPGATAPFVLPFTGLNAPQGVAVDAAGNVYATDTTSIYKLTPAGVQTTFLGNAGSPVTGIAVDAAGNIYALIGIGLNIYPGNSPNNGYAIPPGLTTPRGIFADLSGNLYVADNGQPGFLTFNRTAAAYTFPASSNSYGINLISTGNLPLTTPTFTQSDTTDFTVTPATSNGCSGALAVGTNCALTATFNPTTSGTKTDLVTFSSNFTNATPITLTLTGTAAAQTTTTTLAVSPTTLVYGSVETLTATVAGATSTPNNGTVNFYNNLTTLIGSANVTAGQAVYQFVPGVGNYSVTATYVPSGIVYATSTSTPAKTFTVTPATLTITANNASKLFGAANPTFTYTATGYVNNDTAATAYSGTPTETTTATTTSPAGTYPITITQGSLASTNYTFVFVNGTLSVTGGTAQTITFGALANQTYGVAPITLMATASSGLGVSYTVTGPATVTGSTLTITGAGTVSVTANQTGNNTYAAATPVTQSFTVAKAPLTLTATSISKVYGSANPALTYTLTGFVNNDTQVTATTGAPTETTTATQTSGVGTYPITIAQGTLAAANYTFTPVNGTLTVTPATLTLTANNFTRAYGTANPTFSGTLIGAVNGDVLTETFTTTATTTSPAGTYAIVPGVTGANAANYTVVATNGTLTIMAVQPAILLTATPTLGTQGTTSIALTATVSSPNGVPTGTVNFLSGGAQVGSGTLTNGVYTLNITTLPVGTDSITAVYVTSTNFTTNTSNIVVVTIIAGFGVTSSTTALAFQPNYQEAQALLSINPGGRTDTLTFACQGLPAKITCAFSPATLSLAGLTTVQTVQLLVSNSAATGAQRGIARVSEPTRPSSSRNIAFAALPFAALLLFGLRRRKRPRLFLLALLSLGAIAGLSGCGTSPSNLNQASGTYPFTVTVNSGATTLQTLNYTLTIP